MVRDQGTEVSRGIVRTGSTNMSVTVPGHPNKIVLRSGNSNLVGKTDNYARNYNKR